MAFSRSVWAMVEGQIQKCSGSIGDCASRRHVARRQNAAQRTRDGKSIGVMKSRTERVAGGREPRKTAWTEVHAEQRYSNGSQVVRTRCGRLPGRYARRRSP